MLKMLRTLGIACWTGCILTLLYQAGAWMLTASWPPLSLLDLLGWDMTSPVRSLPMEYMVKAFYVLAVTELALAFWWLGVACFILAMAWRIFRK